MRWEEIKNAFKDQWVLVKVDKVDSNLNIVEGEVLAYSKDKDEVYKKLLQIRPKEFSVKYTGMIPEDLAVVLVMEKKTLKQRIEEVQEQELNNILEQGYKARKQESLSIAEEYQLVDIEGWDEY